MRIVALHDKNRIKSYLSHSPQLHIYSIGDLDDFFWPYTVWYGLEEASSLEAIALLYFGASPPTLLAFTNEGHAMKTLFAGILGLLPKQFYAHLSPSLVSVFKDSYMLESHGLHYKMALKHPEMLQRVNTDTAMNLNLKDLAKIDELYTESYPGNWFDSRMLETGQYFGVWKENKLASIAGIHVYSPRFGVAALGNVTTHPDYRKQGLASMVTAKLCQSLLAEGLKIGLNVKADNHGAIACYKKLGFEIIANYEELMISQRS